MAHPFAVTKFNFSRIGIVPLNPVTRSETLPELPSMPTDSWWTCAAGEFYAQARQQQDRMRRSPFGRTFHPHANLTDTTEPRSRLTLARGRHVLPMAGD